MKTPLLASSSTQNSARSSKLPYRFLDTRKPFPLSATTTPSSRRQLASPILFQLSRSLPSNRVIQPCWVWAATGLKRIAAPKAVKPRAVKKARRLCSLHGARWLNRTSTEGASQWVGSSAPLLRRACFIASLKPPFRALLPIPLVHADGDTSANASAPGTSSAGMVAVLRARVGVASANGTSLR